MIGRFLRLLLAMLLAQGLLLLLFVFGLAALVSRDEGEPVVHDHSALSVRLSGELIEYPTLPNVPFLNEVPMSQTAILQSLEHAATDGHIDAVLLEIDFPALGWGMATELRAGIERFRAAGKPVWAHADYLDEQGLYLAAACDSIWLSPHGKLVLQGFAAGMTYYRGLLDKVGVRTSAARIGAYKSGTEPWTRSGMSDAARANLNWMLDELWSELTTVVGRDRRLEPEALQTALGRGVLEAEEAHAAGLVDGVTQSHELRARFEGADGRSRLVPVTHYRKHASRPGRGRRIAVVHARGVILGGKNGYHPAIGTILGAASVVGDLRAAVHDDDVAAIVLRIDSPGGEILASDAIGAAVGRAREAKPVVVSMVDVAASGGYMIAYRANRIVAQPTTITGSIGIYSFKLNLRGLYDKIGLSRDYVTRGSYPFLWSDYHDWSAAEESLVVRSQWSDYRRWIADVAARRGIEVAAVDSVGRGRVWMGRQAQVHRLVDELGDMHRAVEIACELAGLPEPDAVPLVHYPKETGLLDVLEERSAFLSSLVASWVQAARLPRGAGWALLDLELRR